MERAKFSRTVEADHYNFIDGLRAVAVAMVILFHFQLLNLSGGFLGVDVFFVISGFVITEIIQKNHISGQYSITNFWRRRVLRIIPNFYATTLIFLIISYFIYLPEDFIKNIQSAKISLLFFSNVHFFLLTDYFSSDKSFLLFLHHWSLSVEEQFYIIFPLYISLIYKFWRFRLYLIISLLIAALLCYFCYYQTSAMHAFYLLPARAWEFLLGSAIAFVPKHHFLNSLRSGTLSIIGLFLIVVAALGLVPSIHFVQLDLFCAVLGTALVISGCLFGTENPVSSFLSAAPLRFLGRISFSLYLVHWPVYVLAQYISIEPLTLPNRIALLLPTFAIAWTFWRVVEVPFRGNTVSQALEGARLWWSLIVATAFLLGSFNFIIVNKTEFFKQSPAVSDALGGRLDFNPKRSSCHSDEQFQPIDPGKACSFGGATKATIAAWGDSHAAELAVALGGIAEAKNESVLQLSSSSCPPAVGLNFIGKPGCRSRNDAVLSFLLKHPEIDTVVLALKYGGYQEHADESLLEGLSKASRTLTRAGKRVIIIGPFPRPGFDVPHGLARALYFNRQIKDNISMAEYRLVYGETVAALKKIGASSDATVFDPTDAMCTQAKCPLSENWRPLYFDDNHPSVLGASKVAAMLNLYPKGAGEERDQ